jgi:transcriptional regulator with XRE-family HTH domain
MPPVKRPELAAEARRLNLEQLARLGAELRASRLRRRLTQEQLAELAGISRSAESRIERGQGGGQSLDTWQRLAIAAGTPLLARLQRDPLEDTADAGHLAMQELVLRLGRRAGARGLFELATKQGEPWRSTDVGLRDDVRRRLWLIECWNSFGDIGAGARSSARKVAEAERLAIALGGQEPYAVRSCWVVRDTRRNRELVRRYPEVFAARFPASSRGWVAALETGVDPPLEPGLCGAIVTRRRSLPGGTDDRGRRSPD